VQQLEVMACEGRFVHHLQQQQHASRESANFCNVNTCRQSVIFSIKPIMQINMNVTLTTQQRASAVATSIPPPHLSFALLL
jgi:hypothetical protein